MKLCLRKSNYKFEKKAELQIPLNSLGIKVSLIRSETSESVLLGQAKSTFIEKEGRIRFRLMKAENS